MSTLTRRGFLILGGTGAAGVALAGCGAEEDPRGEGADAELFAAAIETETTYGVAGKALADQQGVSALIDEQSTARLQELSSLSDEQPSGATNGSSGAQVTQAASDAIAAYSQLARLGSTEDVRRIGTQFLAQVAAELAVVRELGGDEVVPYAFVTGLAEPPLASTDDAPTGETTTTTTTTTGGG